MEHFKDVEFAKVRMEEKAKFHKEFDKLKQELERTYETKARALMDREKNAIDRLQKQQEVENFQYDAALSTSQCSLAEFTIALIWDSVINAVICISRFVRLKKKTCICRDSRSWKKLKCCGTERMSWGWEWRLLKSKSFFCFNHSCYALSLWALVRKEFCCVRTMTGLVKCTRRRSRPVKICWGGENWQWRLWRTHTTRGWRMNFPGILTDVSFVQFLYGPHCHHKLDIFSLLNVFSLSCWFTLPLWVFILVRDIAIVCPDDVTVL